MHSLSARTARALSCGSSTIAITLALLNPSAAFAQDTPATTNDQAEQQSPISESTSTESATNPVTTGAKNTIIVTGQRQALQTSQQIKKNSDTVVDSITATDIGAFPDKSVAEALQRIPGITVNRFAATSDTAHFSAEPSGVIIRGLPQVRSEFNGRDTFSANSSRGLSWTDITPELLAGVDAYKNQTADMIEGGIAGTVNLRTRLPFDAPGQLLQLGARANYGDLSTKWTPDINGFYSNRWVTGAGEFGVMANVAYSRVKTRSQGIQYGRTGIFEGGLFPDSTGTVYVPSTIEFRDNEYDRKRTGIAGALQWKSNDHKWLATAQYLRSTYKTTWQERGVGASFFDLYGSDVRFRYTPGGAQLNEIPVNAAGADPYSFDSDGNFQSGTFEQGRDVAWWGNPPANGGPAVGAIGFGVNENGDAMFNQCYTWMVGWACDNPNYGVGVNTASRYNNNRNMTQDAAFNLKWEPTNDLHFNFDGQYVDSKIDNYDIEIDFASYADVFLDQSGDKPTIAFLDPTNVNQSSGGLANPNNWYVRSVMDHLEDSKGHELALRWDGDYDFHSDWLDSVKWGVRYADRDQTVQWSTYNWHNIANTWTDYYPCAHPFWNLDSQPTSCGNVNFNGYPSGYYNVDQFGNSFHGGSLGSFPFVPFDFLAGHGADGFSAEQTGVGSFIPICDRNGQATPGGDVIPVELPNSCFTPDEITDVSEKTTAAYLMIKFGGPDALLGTIPVSGNIGLRYVDTKDVSSGALRYATFQGVDPTQCPATPLVPGGLTGTGVADTPPPGAPPVAPFPAYCYLTPEEFAFASGGGDLSVAHNNFHNWLPSFNVRFDLSPKWILRFAASKAISRPDIGFLKNYTAISASLPNGSDLSDSRWVLGSDGLPVGVNPYYSAAAYNPYLKPATAWQFDVSLENYFATVGQFSVAGFYKKFDDYIQYGTFNLDVTNGGTTRTVLVRGPANGPGAKIYGFEAAYQRYFDFLPGWMSGFGVQANFTLVENSGVKNQNLTPVGNAGGDITNAGNANSALDPGTLEGLSKYSYNLVGMYDKGRVSARIAYNWRSKYLVTAVDCCVYLPVWQKSSGFLDASVRYRITDSIELSVEGSNLLNTKTVLMQQITDESSPEGKIILTPNAWFQNDRRFILGIRWKMGG